MWQFHRFISLLRDQKTKLVYPTTTPPPPTPLKSIPNPPANPSDVDFVTFQLQKHQTCDIRWNSSSPTRKHKQQFYTIHFQFKSQVLPWTDCTVSEFNYIPPLSAHCLATLTYSSSTNCITFQVICSHNIFLEGVWKLIRGRLLQPDIRVARWSICPLQGGFHHQPLFIVGELTKCEDIYSVLPCFMFVHLLLIDTEEFSKFSQSFFLRSSAVLLLFSFFTGIFSQLPRPFSVKLKNYDVMRQSSFLNKGEGQQIRWYFSLYT